MLCIHTSNSEYIPITKLGSLKLNDTLLLSVPCSQPVDEERLLPAHALML